MTGHPQTAPVPPSLAQALAGRYAIAHQVGAGGMARVYLARDLRHDRNVALKVLNPELGAVLGVERFLAEIKTTANLQHPNLLPLFDSGEADGVLFYVMPYIEGESLRRRLDREKQLPVDEAVRLAAAIASALDYAHRHGVIHRDMKPENVLMHEGTPLVADFGIALAVSNAGGERITQTGLSLGTPQYMSPEQATGDRVVDGRTDIYSLGAIAYEMLTGDPPHTSSTAQGVIAKLLTEVPARVRARRPSVPAHVDEAVARALEKLAADRFGTAKEFAAAILGASVGTDARPATGEAQPLAAPARRAWRMPGREVVAWSLAATAMAGTAYLATRGDARPDAPVVRMPIELQGGLRVNDVIVGPTVAVSPDGTLLAYSVTGGSTVGIQVRRTNELTPRMLTGAAGRNLVFSPDGRWLAFTEGNTLRKVSVEGGDPVTLGNTGGAVPYGLAWAPDGTIYIGTFSGMWKVPSTGGEPVEVRVAQVQRARTGMRWPLVLPEENAIVFAGGNNGAVIPRLFVLDLGRGEVHETDHTLAMPLGVMDGQLVYVAPTGGLMALAFDGARPREGARAVQVDEGVLVDGTAGAKAALSPSGTLFFLRGRATLNPVLVRRDGGAEAVLLREAGAYSNPRLSPDGRRVAMTVFGTNATDVWVLDIARNTFTRVTTEGVNLFPEWTPDGRELFYISTRGSASAIWKSPADGSAPATVLHRPQVEPFEAVMSSDARWLVYRSAPGARLSRDIIAVPLTGEDRSERVLVSSAFSENQPRLSPDGRWLAYMSNESGRFEIYVRPFPGPGARIQVSDNGGSEPLWSRSGRTLYYRQGDGEVVEVAVTPGASLAIGGRTTIRLGAFLAHATHPNYDVAPDGRFLVLRRSGAESQAIVVHNWRRELQTAIATPR